jgi:hypothetical protein
MPDFKLSATLEGHSDDVRLLIPASGYAIDRAFNPRKVLTFF